MDETHRPTDRWLPLLGGLLIAAGLIAYSPRIWNVYLGEFFSTRMMLYRITHFSPLLVGGLTVLASRRRVGSTIPAAVFWMAVAALLALEMSPEFDIFGSGDRTTFFGIFGLTGTSLQDIGAPLLWGSALARRFDPGAARLQKTGRISAGLVQLGFVLFFVVLMRGMADLRFPDSGGATAAVATFWNISQVAARLLLLWCSILSVRSAMDPAVIVRRARRIHRLMIFWICADGMGRILVIVLSALQDRRFMDGPRTYHVWRAAAHILLLLTAAFAAAAQSHSAPAGATPQVIEG